jgi:hypothetical protein
MQIPCIGCIQGSWHALWTTGLSHTAFIIPDASDVGIANQELVHLRAQHSVPADNAAPLDAVGTHPDRCCCDAACLRLRDPDNPDQLDQLLREPGHSDLDTALDTDLYNGYASCLSSHMRLPNCCYWLLYPTLSRGINRSSDPCFKKTLPAAEQSLLLHMHTAVDSTSLWRRST